MVQKKLGDYGGEKKKASKSAKKPAKKAPTGPIARRAGYSVHVREHWRRPR